MNKVLTLFEGEADPFLLVDSGFGKVSLAFLLEDNVFNYAYYQTASMLLNKRGTINITDYKIEQLNQELDEIPQHIQFEYYMIFTTNPTKATKFINEAFKKTGCELKPDYLDYYTLSQMKSLTGSEVSTIPDHYIHKINNKTILTLLSINSKLREIKKVINGEKNTLNPISVNIGLQSYPIDYFILDDTLYEFNYHTGKLKEITKITPEYNHDYFFGGNKLFIYEDMITVYEKKEQYTEQLTGINITDERITLIGEHNIYQMPPFSYFVIASKPVSNYYLTKFILKNYEKTPDGVKIDNYLIPKRFNNKINPLLIMKENHYYKAPNNLVKNYNYITITTPI